MPASPTLLALDTATSRCSVALLTGGRVFASVRDVEQRHTEFLLPMVDALLAEHGVALERCDAIAFGAGPGSFTGLRVACGAAQGLAFGVDRPVVPVGNLDATALEAFTLEPDATSVAVVLDARMGEVYCNAFARDGETVRALGVARLASPADACAYAEREGVAMLAGSALEAYAAAFSGFAGLRQIEAHASASSIARLARAAFDAGHTVPAAEAAPLYVRDRIALTIDERRAGARLAGQASA